MGAGESGDVGEDEEVKLVFTPGAMGDLREASHWYGEQQQGLEVRFTFAVELALRRVEASPAAYAIWHETFRRVAIRPFAYFLVYQIRDRDIIIVAVIHERRGREQIDRQIRRS